MENVTFEDFTDNLSTIIESFRDYAEQQTGSVEPRPFIEWEELFGDFAAELWSSNDDLDELPF